jgi:hypothetical protein
VQTSHCANGTRPHQALVSPRLSGVQKNGARSGSQSPPGTNDRVKVPISSAWLSHVPPRLRRLESGGVVFQTSIRQRIPGDLEHRYLTRVNRVCPVAFSRSDVSAASAARRWRCCRATERHYPGACAGPDVAISASSIFDCLRPAATDSHGSGTRGGNANVKSQRSTVRFGL